MTDAQRYVHAMINGDHNTLVRIEQKYDLYGYSPEIVTVGLRAIAEGKDGHAAIAAYIAGGQS